MVLASAAGMGFNRYMADTPQRLFTGAQAREIDARAIAAAGGDPLLLMQRAGAAAFRRLRARWPQARRVLVACGRGNNGGDGWVVATLARRAGFETLLLHVEGEPGTDEARRARDDALAAGVVPRAFHAGDSLPLADVLVDGVLGIGLRRAPEGDYAALIAAINRQSAPVLALDLPSGLDADTGHAPDACVRAALTVCFIAAKRGLFTGVAPAHVGELVLETLGVAASIEREIQPAVRCLAPRDVLVALPPRAPIVHKGDHGHVLVIGGDHGFGGAVRLSAEAAARSGAGLVSVATRASHVGALLAARPELMVLGVDERAALAPILARASVIAIGPGLGQGEWGRGLLEQALAAGRPTVLDADALNLLARERFGLPAACVITPHPGEAARLLECSVPELQADRFEAARRLSARFGAVAVLKGAGTIIAQPDGLLSLCPVAEPGMASGGMGDVLTGVIAALLAQGLGAADAAQIGVAVHAFAARAAARAGGARGMLAGDVIDALRAQVNP
jgi:NAD(P)H-hydrate epimerase